MHTVSKLLKSKNCNFNGYVDAFMPMFVFIKMDTLPMFVFIKKWWLNFSKAP